MLRLIHSIRKKYSHFKNIVRDVDYLNEESHKDQGNLGCERGTFLTLSPIASGIDGYSIVLLIFYNTSAFAAKFTGVSLRAI